MAYDKKAAAKTGQSLYDEVLKEGFDIRTLTAGVSAASKIKSQQNKKLGKKVLAKQSENASKAVNLDAKRLKAAALDARDKARRLEKAAKNTAEKNLTAASESMAALETALDVAVVSLSAPTVVDATEKLGAARTAIQRLPVSPARKGLLQRLALAKASHKALVQTWLKEKARLDKVATQRLLLLRQRYLKDGKVGKTPLQIRAEALRGSPPASDSGGLWRGAKLGLKAIGASFHAGKGVTHQNDGRMSLTQSMSSLISRFENKPIMASSIKAVDKSLRYIGREIHGTGADTMKWVNKHLTGLARSVKSFIMSPFTGGGSRGLDASDLLGLAVLGPSLIAPLIAGIDKVLSERYGDSYISDFFTKAWKSSKEFISDQIKGFFSKLFGGGGSGKEEIISQSPSTKNERPAGDREVVLLNAAKVLTDPKSTAVAKADATAVLDSALKNTNGKTILVNASTKYLLEELGYPTTNVQVRKNTPDVTTPADKPTSVTPKLKPIKKSESFWSNLSDWAMSSPTSRLVKPGEASAVDATPKGPTVATPKPAEPAKPAASPASGGKAAGAGGLSVSMIPTSTVPDSMYAYNLGMLA